MALPLSHKNHNNKSAAAGGVRNMENTIKLLRKIWKFFYKKKEPDLRKVTEDEYFRTFIENSSEEKILKAYDVAWSAKNFEIENYWRRATYFWAFQVASFAAYFGVFSSSFYAKNTEVLYCVICIGFVTALAWALINNGSKSWQRNWENHVDMLEDLVTGPLYKTVSVKGTFSVSKINEIVSYFITTIWLLLGAKYFMENITFSTTNNNGINWVVVGSTISVIYFSGAMWFGHGRGRFGKRTVEFNRRGEQNA